MKKVWREVFGDDAGLKEVFAAIREGLKVMCLYRAGNEGEVFIGSDDYGDFLKSDTEQPVRQIEELRKFRIEVKPPEAGDGCRLLDGDEVVCKSDEYYRFDESIWVGTSVSIQDKGLFYRRLQDGVEKIEYEASPFGVCKTECKHVDAFIGSTVCKQCKKHVGQNMENKIVLCSWARDHQEPELDYVDVPVTQDYEGDYEVLVPDRDEPWQISAAVAHKDFIGYVWDDYDGSESLRSSPVLYRASGGTLHLAMVHDATKEVCKTVRFQRRGGRCDGSFCERKKGGE